MNFICLPFLAATLALVVAVQAAEEIAPPNGVADFNSVKDILDLVPKRALMQLKNPREIEAAKTTANAAFAQRALHKWITLKIRIKKWQPYEAQGVIPSKYRVEAEEEIANVSGALVGVRAWVNLGAAAEPIITKMVHGEELTVTSYLNRVELAANPGDAQVKLNLELSRTTIKPKP